MPITVEPRSVFSYSLWMTLGVFLLVVCIGIVLLVLALRKKKPAEKIIQQPKPIEKPVDQMQLKEQYSALIRDLEQQCKSGSIDERKAHQNLSVMLRRFVFEATGVKVHNYTLSEIQRAQMPQLYDVIEICYAPEFSPDKEGDIVNTIIKARMVIEEWHL